MKKSVIFATNIFQFKNEKLATELKKYILNKEIKGIESNVAPIIKHNLDESKLPFFLRRMKLLKKQKFFLLNVLKIVLMI